MGVVVPLGGRASQTEWKLVERRTTNPVEYGTVSSSIIFHQLLHGEKNRKNVISDFLFAEDVTTEYRIYCLYFLIFFSEILFLLLLLFR